MSNVSIAARAAYDLAFQISPIILKGGIFSAVNGQMMPIIALLGQLAAFLQGVRSGGLTLDSFYARFLPMPGATVLKNTLGQFPSANQQTAANAAINQPLNISLMMLAPVKAPGGYLTKLAIFTSLRNSLKAHIDAGGTFHIATPSYVFTDCILMSMHDITSDSTQQQIMWQLDFEKPLVTRQDVQSATNSLMSLLQGGGRVDTPTWSGLPSSASAGSPNIVKGLPGQVSEFTGLNQ